VGGMVVPWTWKVCSLILPLRSMKRKQIFETDRLKSHMSMVNMNGYLEFYGEIVWVEKMMIIEAGN
jgi:hypothetical protein